MPSTRSFGPSYSKLLSPSTNITTIALLALAFVFTVAATATQAQAQTLPSVSTQGSPYTCPLTGPNGQPTGWVQGTTCQDATLINCPNADDLPFTYGYEAQVGTYRGTIVILNGAGGTTPNDDTGQPLAVGPYYLQQGFEIVQLEWDTPWKDTTGTSGTNVLAAACRPATFLSYVHGNSLLFHGTSQNHAGMCAQGTSAGSAAIAYTLAWYNGGSYLDKVELLSGPVLSDIEQGCEVSPPSDITVCPTTETQCHRGSTLQPRAETPEYIDGYANGPRNWTGNPDCAGRRATTTTEDEAWYTQSIVVTTPGSQYNYANTDITGWLCASVANNGPMNNSSSQGQIFYNTVGSNFDVFAVTTCDMAEGVTGTTAQVPFLSNQNGLTAIENDMAFGTTNTSST